MEHGVARDAGIVDQHLDRAEFGLHLLHAVGASVKGRHVPLEHCNAGFGFEFRRRFVVAVVDGRDLVTGSLQCLGDGGADAAGAASN